ncbi:transposase [Nitratireductor sp. CH_MIT9313-5]|uniref:transposase n=1 Tax=Nitratireductor sp. CH_MIT9313-5 TaxID=3107764 RepID=UPI0030099081
MLLFADESEALTHPHLASACLARAWAKRGADLRVEAPGQAKKVAMMGALDWRDRRLIVATARTRRSADFAAFLEEPDHRHGPRPGPKPGQCQRPVVIVPGNGPIHTSKATKAALAARAHWLSVKWLPEYAPEGAPDQRVRLRRDGGLSAMAGGQSVFSPELLRFRPA